MEVVSNTRPSSRQTEPAEQRATLLWLDIAKGIGICLVVFGHAANGLATADLLPWKAPIEQVYYIVYTFHMPLFFFVSGFTVPISLKRGPKDFLTRKIKQIAYPYFIWSVIQGLSQYLFSKHLNHPFEIQSLYLIWINPIAQFWFLYILMIYHVIAAVIGRYLWALWLTALIFFFAFNYFATPFDLGAFYFLCYVAGIALHGAASGWSSSYKRPMLAGCFSLASCALYAVFIGSIVNWNYAVPAILPATAAGVFGVLIISQAMKSELLRRYLSYLGQISLSIYVMHVMAVAGTRVIAVHLHLTLNPYVLLTLCTVVGVVLPVIAHMIFGRLNMLAVLGLESHRNAKASKVSEHSAYTMTNAGSDT